MTQPKELKDKELKELTDQIEASLAAMRDVKKVFFSITRKLASRGKGGRFVPRSAIKERWLDQFRQTRLLAPTYIEDARESRLRYARMGDSYYPDGLCQYCRDEAKFELVLPFVMYGKVFLKKQLVCSKHNTR